MARRFYHYIRSNAMNETMQRAVFVDCETDDYLRSDGITEKRLRFGWACFTERTGRGEWTKPHWKKFLHYEDFWLWLVQYARPKKKLWVWCHNSNFDYPALHVFSHPAAIGWETKGLLVEAPPTLIKLVSGGQTILLADTLNIWRMPLKTLGKKVGMEKLKMPKEWKDDATDDAYCQRDVMIMAAAMQEWCDFLQREDMGNFKPTIAGQAMTTYRHKYMDTPILIDAHEDALKLARNCYKGGRVECGFIGHLTQPIFHLDVNSMYPYVMSKYEFPTRLVTYKEYVSPRGLGELLKRYAICAKVILKTDEPFAPVLHDNKLIFPVGEFDAHLSTPEIEYALERSYIREVYCAACYERGPIFRRFALDLYDKKEQATREGRMLDADHWKLLLNSFYGKWGQNGRHYSLSTDRLHPTKKIIIAWNVQTRKKTYYRYFGNFVLSRTDDGESRESHPAIAAHVTSHARMVLWALIRQLAPKDYFYCDTDAVFTSQAGFDQLYDRDKQFAIGGLKHVATYQDVWINGAKDYVRDGERVLKGVRYEADQVNETSFQQIRWYRLAGLARAGSLDMPLTSVITKTLRRSYNKGIVGADGFVTPFHWPLSNGAGNGSGSSGE
jgi:hypothetical protein